MSLKPEHFQEGLGVSALTVWEGSGPCWSYEPGPVVGPHLRRENRFGLEESLALTDTASRYWRPSLNPALLNSVAHGASKIQGDKKASGSCTAL